MGKLEEIGFHIIDKDDEVIEVLPISEIQIKKSYKGLTGHWSKYGGRRTEVAVNQWGEVTVSEEWYCQSCNNPQPPELTPYRYEYPENEYVRVCAVCMADGCIALHKRVNNPI